MSFSYDQLIKQYPDLFQTDKMRISCGLGWFELISVLLSKIDSQAKYEKVDIRVLQIKEKFGGLRFYIDNHKSEYVNGLISMSEAMSYYICENCGDKGKPIRGGWIKTRCNKCSNPDS